jgi:DNA polymerase-3 subunit epsilon
MTLLKLSAPLVVLDLETTGTNIYRDLIIEIAATKIEPDGKMTQGYKRFNPGIPIPKEASDIHHIMDADVANAPSFKSHAEGLLKFVSGCDFAGYNIKRFDLPMLEEEFKRAGLIFAWRDRRIIDSYIMWLKGDPRTLEVAVKTFLGKEHTGAHGAKEDVAVIMDLIDAQIKKWNLPTDPKALCEWIDPPNPDAYDPDGKLIWKGTDLVLTFGKNKGRTLREMAQSDPSFLNWIVGKDFTDVVKKAVAGVLSNNHPIRPAAKG